MDLEAWKYFILQIFPWYKLPSLPPFPPQNLVKPQKMLFWQQVHLLWDGPIGQSEEERECPPAGQTHSRCSPSGTSWKPPWGSWQSQLPPRMASTCRPRPLLFHISHFPQCVCLTHVSAFFVPMTLTLHVFHISFFVSQKLPLQQLKRLNTAQPQLDGEGGM